MLENLFFTALGWLLGFLTPGSFWDYKLVKDVRARKSQQALNRILESAQNRVAVGAYEISSVAAVQAFKPSLGIDDVPCTYDSDAIGLPRDLERLQEEYVPRKKAELRALGRTVDFNDTYGLRSVRIDRPQQAGGIRANRPQLHFEPTNFRFYLGINEILDEPLLDGESGLTTIRERHLRGSHVFEWSKLQSVPIHMWFATVTAVITAERQMVVAIRSGMQAIAGPDSSTHSNWRAALSCAEGMLRPADSRTPDPQQEPSPFCTVARGLADELGLEEGRHFTQSAIQLIGLGFDTQRYQPIATFIVEVEPMGFMDVYKCWQTAKDRQENQTLIPVPLTSHNLARLMLGKVEYEGQPVRLFSNHQQLGAFLVASHLLGASVVAGSLKNHS